MYIDQKLSKGYNEYTKVEVENGYGSMMDVGILLMEPGDIFELSEPHKEVAWILLSGSASAEFEGKSVKVSRPNPFDYNPYCLHMPAQSSCTLRAEEACKFYIQKTLNDRAFPLHLYTPEETHTWRRGDAGECAGCIKRDVRTCFDYESAPYSNMVLGEVVNLPGKWSSYPPHAHPQPEVYFYHFEKPQGFGAGWIDGEIAELHHNGLAIITKGTHPMSMAPGYACCYVWGIRHFDGNPWEKTRIDDPEHLWLNDPKAEFWNG